MDKEEFTSLLVSVSSSLAVVAAILWQYILAAPIMAIVLAASLSYYFQHRMQANIRKYEIRKLAVLEALGPIYGEMLKMRQSFDANQTGLSRNWYGNWAKVWSTIRRSHRFYVIQEPLRSAIERYYTRLGELVTKSINVLDQLQLIEKQVWPRIVEISDANSAFFIVRGNNSELRAWMQGAVYWGVNPSQLTGLYLVDLTIHGTIPNNESNQLRFENGDIIKKIVNDFWNIASREVDNNPQIVEERKLVADLREESSRLQLMLENEFAKWAG